MWKNKNDKLNTIIGKDTEFKGNISTQETVRVEGKIEGNNNLSTFGDLIVSETGKVFTDVKVNNITIAGEVHGNLECSGKLELLSTGKLIGNIKVSKLYINNGAVFKGDCTMLDSPEESQSPQEITELENTTTDEEEETFAEENYASTTSPTNKTTKISTIDNTFDNTFDNTITDKIKKTHDKLYLMDKFEEVYPEKKEKEAEENEEDKEINFQLSKEDFLDKLDRTGKIGLDQFHFNSNFELEKCPGGITPKNSNYKPKKELNISYFNSTKCLKCPLLNICRVSKDKDEMVLRATKKSILAAKNK